MIRIPNEVFYIFYSATGCTAAYGAYGGYPPPAEVLDSGG